MDMDVGQLDLTEDVCAKGEDGKGEINREKQTSTTAMCCGLEKGITEYFNNAGIQGLEHLGKSPSKFGKLFWILAFICAFVFLGFFIKELLEQFFQRMVILVEDDRPTYIFEIPFPAVTICPQFKIKADNYTYETTGEKLLDDPDVEISYMDRMQFALGLQICDRSWTDIHHPFVAKYKLTKLDKKIVDLLHALSPGRASVIWSNEFKDEELKYFNEMPYGYLFHTIITTEGLCFTFNMVSDILRQEHMHNDYVYHNITEKTNGWEFINYTNFNLSYPKRTWMVGEQSSLSVKLSAWKINLLNKCAPSLLGYKILIHAPAAYPNMYENYIPLQHEMVFRIKIKPTITKTAQNLREYTPEKRQCYFNDERKLQFYKYYNIQNCKLECFANYTLAKYKCVHFALPRTQATPICGSHINFAKAYADCQNSEMMANLVKTLSNYSCSIINKKQMTEPNLECKCLPVCDSVSYDYSYDKYGLSHLKEQKENSVTHLMVYFVEKTIYGKIRQKLHAYTDVVSNFGSILGLFIGASVISGFELVYLCLIKPCVKHSRKRFTA